MVSILLPTYNAETTLGRAIDSILGQSYRKIELIVIDDASTDGTSAVVDRYTDRRLRYMRLKSNAGLSSALNIGLHEADGDYIARMDADDVSLPRRLEAQVSLLRLRPEISACGGSVRAISTAGSEIWRYPEDHEAIRARLLFRSPFAHPAVMLRAADVVRFQIAYDEDRRYGAEDWDVWRQIDAQGGGFANLDEVVLDYNLGPGTTAGTVRAGKWRDATTVASRILRDAGIDATPEEADLHCRIGFLSLEGSDRSTIERSERWLSKLLAANEATGHLPHGALAPEVGQRWFDVCAALSSRVPGVWRSYYRSALRDLRPRPQLDAAGMVARRWMPVLAPWTRR